MAPHWFRHVARNVGPLTSAITATGWLRTARVKSQTIHQDQVGDEWCRLIVVDAVRESISNACAKRVPSLAGAWHHLSVISEHLFHLLSPPNSPRICGGFKGVEWRFSMTSSTI